MVKRCKSLLSPGLIGIPWVLMPGFSACSEKNDKLPGYPVSDDPGSRNSWYGAVICGFAKLFAYLHGC